MLVVKTVKLINVNVKSNQSSVSITDSPSHQTSTLFYAMRVDVILQLLVYIVD